MEQSNSDGKFIEFCNDLFKLLSNIDLSFYKNTSRLRALSNRAKQIDLNLFSDTGLRLPLKEND